MREFNCRGNTNHSKYDLFWEYFICVKDLENGSGAQHCRKAAADTDTMTNVSFAPGLLWIRQIIQANINLLQKEGKLKDKVFLYQVSDGSICNYHQTMNTVVDHSITVVYYHT